MMTELDRIRESSRYLATLLNRPRLADWLWEQKNLHRRFGLTDLYRSLADAARKACSPLDLQHCLREFKQSHFLRIGGRDLLGWADLPETTAQISDLARVALQVSIEVLLGHPGWWLEEGGRAEWEALHDGVRLVVLGLGKLGGEELNYVSDVDIIFLRDAKAEAPGGGVPCASALSSLCQWLIRLMADRVDGDRVFQVDLALRPRGKDGPLVPSMAGAAEYYLLHGQAWERQMLLKARAVAGDRALGTEFLQEVHPFIFRRFLDFQSIDEMRNMRDRILREAAQRGAGLEQFDVKLGLGGIREVEFIAQAFQLIHGGRHPELEESNTLRCLEKLHKLELFPRRAAGELAEAYIFLRRVEHWVQLDQNRQTQKLPRSPDSRKRLFLALGFGDDEAAFLRTLGEYTAAVHNHFTALFHESRRPRGMPPEEGEAARGKASGGLEKLAGGRPPEAWARFRERLDARPASIRSSALEAIESLPRLKSPETIEKVAVRLERYLGQVQRRPGLAKALDSAPAGARELFRAIAQSGLAADLLAHHPSVGEALLGAPGTRPAPGEWEAASERSLERRHGYEEGLEWLRRLKSERMLRLALAALEGELDNESLEGALTALAEFMIRKTYDRVLRNLGAPPDPPLAVLGLGSLGGREMGFLSDLDLVFVYDPLPHEPHDRIPAEVIRLAQRLMGMLRAPLQEGPGYSVDAELRPTGNRGPLVATWSSWVEYYSKEADIWEIQALLRMRPLAGRPGLCARVAEKAEEIRYAPRDPEKVWKRILGLRERMEKERSRETPEALDLKLGAGGLVDIVFLAQGILLTEGWKAPRLRTPSTRAALREMAACPAGLIPRELPATYEVLRALEHRLNLHTNSAPALLTPREFETLREMGLWPAGPETRRASEWTDILRLRRCARCALRSMRPGL
jgi:glutamate-ammonia-ligase adenylyltransferase